MTTVSSPRVGRWRGASSRRDGGALHRITSACGASRAPPPPSLSSGSPLARPGGRSPSPFHGEEAVSILLAGHIHGDFSTLTTANVNRPATPPSAPIMRVSLRRPHKPSTNCTFLHFALFSQVQCNFAPPPISDNSDDSDGVFRRDIPNPPFPRPEHTGNIDP